MRRAEIAFTCLAIIGPLVSGANAAQNKLTIHHVGEYAGVPWGAPGVEIEPGSRADRVKTLNFAVSSINLKDDMSEAFLQRWANVARCAGMQGKVFLPRIYFWDGRDRFEGPLHDFEVYWRRMDQFLAAMPLDNFYGIVLAEENVTYGGRPAVLIEMYRRIKEKYGIRVFQWWSPSGTVPSYIVPSDGWVINEYRLGGARFRRIVQRYLVTGAPLVVMPWAAWDRGRDPWPRNGSGPWQRLEDQLQTCREYNLPTAFYWVYNGGCNFGMMESTFMGEINKRILDWVKEVQGLPADYDGLPSADIGQGDGLEIGPNDKGLLIFVDDFASSQFVEDADVEGFRDLLWEPDRMLALRSWNGRKPQAALTYRFEGEFPVEGIEASVAVPFLEPGSRVALRLSADGGATWPRAAETHGGAAQTLVVSTEDDANFHHVRSFRVRIEMASVRSDGEAAARIDDVRVSARLVVPEDPSVHLVPCPEKPDHLIYLDDFQTQKYRVSAKVFNGEHLEWSRGRIAVRMRPGGSRPELVWHVRSDRPLKNIAAFVDGRANNGCLGTNHYLALSTDGRSWTHEVSTVGWPFNRSGWAYHGLAAEAGDDPDFAGVTEFYVRLRMSAGSFREVHPSLSGIVNRLRIEADAQ